MRNKKGQEFSIGTLMLLVLGVVVLVVVIMGFTLGWSTIFEKLRLAPSQLQALAKVCPTYAEQKLTIDYCQFREMTIDGVKQYVNCDDDRITFEGKSAVAKCDNLPVFCKSLADAKKDVSKIIFNGRTGCTPAPATTPPATP